MVEAVGEGASKLSQGDEVVGQLLIAPLGSAGTYAERVAVTEDAPLARCRRISTRQSRRRCPPPGSPLEIVESLEPLVGKIVLIVGAAGGVGSFATQFAANAGAHVIAVARSDAADRMHG